MRPMSPRALGLALLIALPMALTLQPDTPLEGPRPASASVSVSISLEQLVASASAVVVGAAVERQSRWEEIGGARRIVTYTRIAVAEAVAGDPGGKEVWVRTLGGVVDKVGQSVAGDARIALSSRSLLFLARAGDGALVVAGMAQGHYPVVEEEPAAGGAARRLSPPRTRLSASPDTGAILARPGPMISAREVLVGATLDDAVEAIRRARRASDEKK